MILGTLDNQIENVKIVIISNLKIRTLLNRPCHLKFSM